MKVALITFFLVILSTQAKPSWKIYGIFIDGVKTEEEAKGIMTNICSVDKKKIKAAEGLSPANNFVLINHDHHGITIQKIAQALMKKGQYKIYVNMLIPDYKKVQGILIGKKLNSLINRKNVGYEIKLIDETKGLFEVILLPGKFNGKGFNFGDLAHPISDPVVYGGLGLNMSFPGKLGKGAMIKNANKKELAFRKKNKKTKKYDPKLMAEHKKLFNFPPEELKEFYK